MTEEIKKENISRPYTHHCEIIDRNSIKNFIRRPWARELRTKKLNAIVSSMKNGTHFREPLTVNEIDNKWYLINGNHRIEAVRKIIGNFPEFKIEADVFKYINLSEEKEHQVFDEINNTSVVNALDKLKEHCVQNKFFELVRNDFPCKLLFRNVSRTDKNSLQANLILSTYINRNSTANKTNVPIEIVNSFDVRDYEKIKNFLNFYINLFGVPAHQTENVMYSHNIFTIVGKIYFNEGDLSKLRKKLDSKKNKIINQAALFSHGFHELPKLYYEITKILDVRRLE